MAEAFNSLFKAECIRNPAMRPKGGWASIHDVEIAVAEHVDWFNQRRLHGEIGQVPPVEFEAAHWASHEPDNYPGEQVPARAGSRTEPPRNPGRFRAAWSASAAIMPEGDGWAVEFLPVRGQFAREVLIADPDDLPARIRHLVDWVAGGG